MTVDLKPITGIFTMEDGTIHTISRAGDTWISGLGIILTTGEEALRSYTSSSKRTILVDDKGQMFPTCKIASIKTVVECKEITLEYR